MIRRGRREFLKQAVNATVGLALLLRTARSQSATWAAKIAELEKRIPQLMEQTRVPGLSIAIVDNAKVRWRRGFGFKDNALKTPVEDDTMFEAASMSKPPFAHTVMKLCEKGVMNLDTPLSRYTSERFLQGDPRLDLITARHVLSHTSGFQNWRSDDEPLKINFTPGEKYLYSGEGYNYLQTVVARLTGQSFEPYMKANLLGPFGMRSSFYVWNAAAQKHMARPHDVKGNPFDNKKSTVESVARYGSAGALLTTPSDYGKFVIEVIHPKESDAFRLRKETIREMLQPVVKIGGPADPSWALGWAVQPKEDGNIIFHGGDNDGFHSLTVASVERRNGVVLMTNGDGGIELISKVLSEELMKPFV